MCLLKKLTLAIKQKYNIHVNALNLIDGFTVFGIEIKLYGVIIAFGMMLGVFVAVKNTKWRSLKADDVYTIALYALPLAIIGARLYYVAFSGQSYTFAEILNIRSGGLAIYGGVIGGAVGVLLFCLIHKKNFILVADVAVVSLILGQAIGRWGNFFNQEAYGYAVTNPAWQWFPFAVFIEAEGAWHLATFFYESLGNVIIFAVLMYLIRKIEKPGIITALYFVMYGVIRMIIEGFRTDSLYWGPFRVSQLLSGVLVVAGIIAIIVIILTNKWKAQNHDQSIEKKH